MLQLLSAILVMAVFLWLWSRIGGILDWVTQLISKDNDKTTNSQT